MQKLTRLTDDWQHWIQENLARGCTPSSLIDMMIKENFDPVFAGLSVYHMSGGGMAQGAVAAPVARVEPAGYVYETPRLPQTGNVIHVADRDVRISFRLSQPVVAVFDNLMSHDECDELIRLSSIKLKRSTTVDPLTGKEHVIDDRSSYGTFFAINENDFIARLDRRIADVMHWPLENGEGIQILNYKIGGEYKTHFDYFPPGDPGSHLHIANGGQRVSTLIMYLNDVEAGGETIFPSINLSVVPKKGSAVYFEYCNSKSQVDPLTLHGGVPVVAGEKWIATKWMRQRRYG